MVFLREDFSHFAKSSKAIKSLVEKEIREGSRPGSRGGSRPGTPSRSRKNADIDKVLTAFRVIKQTIRGFNSSFFLQAIDTDNSGFLDREEFLNFARYALVLTLTFMSREFAIFFV